MQQRRRITLDIYLLWIIVVVRMPFLFKRKSNGRDSILKSVTSFTFPCYLNILQRLITSCHEWAVDSVTAKWYNVMLYFHFLSIPFFSFLDTNDIFTDCKTEGVKVVVDIRCDVISCIITSIWFHWPSLSQTLLFFLWYSHSNTPHIWSYHFINTFIFALEFGFGFKVSAKRDPTYLLIWSFVKIHY
jgi:hypothetical protein